MNDTLYSILDTFASNGGDQYMIRMWHYALAAHESAESGAGNERCDAIPYLAAWPTGLGMHLNADSRILDVGCLGGYGLYDIAFRLHQCGSPIPELLGVDANSESIDLARRMGSVWARDLRVSWFVDSAEHLSTVAAPVDVILCRLVLPYTRVNLVMERFFNVLKPDGWLLLQVHSPGYYWRQLRESSGQWKPMLYYLRPLLNGWVYDCTGLQLNGRLFNETAISARLIQRLCVRHGFECVEQSGYSLKPIYWLRRN